MPLRRYDDVMFVTRTFFESHKLPENLLKPVVYKIYEALSSVYKIYNSQVNKTSEEYLNSLSVLYNDSLDSPKERKNKEEDDHLDNITSISTITYSEEDEEEIDESLLPFFKLNKSF